MDHSILDANELKARKTLRRAGKKIEKFMKTNKVDDELE
jgi:hypothetical protein